MDSLTKFGILTILGCSLLLGMLLVPTAQGIWCYECNSIYNGSCTEFNNIAERSYAVNCDTKPRSIDMPADKNYTFCRKMTAEVDGSHRTIRNCGWSAHPKYDCYHTTSIDIKTTVCQCKEDYCNGASIPKPITAGLPLLLLTVLVPLFSFASPFPW